MKRRSKNLAASGLLLVFFLGLLCSTMAAPGLSLAAVSPCSLESTVVAMAECEHPGYLCGFDYTGDLLPQAALGTSGSDNLLRGELSLASGEDLLTASNEAAVLRERMNPFSIGLHKVSIRLFHSILNL